jgi:dUTP pyrophosphatase
MMSPIKLKVKRLPHCRDLPRYATSGSAGLDLTAGMDKPVTLRPGARAGIPTGIIVEIPEGHEGQVRPRSGLAARAGVTLTNCVGTIDSDYRGEVIVLLINLGNQPYTVEPGERIAQLLVTPVPRVEVVEVEELTPNHERGAGGFGSTGRTTYTCTSKGQASGQAIVDTRS